MVGCLGVNLHMARTPGAWLRGSETVTRLCLLDLELQESGHLVV